MNRLKFQELDLSAAMQKAIADMGFEEASPIQSETIPLMLTGKDIIGQAQTGTGKTAAFAIPTIENLDRNASGPQAIVLCPTRELVIQVTEEFRRLMKYMHGLYVVPVYGGQEIERQLNALKKNPQIIVGTPGRIMDHMRRGSISMRTMRLVILDEADEMLDMGFRDDIELILKDTPADRQTVMFSATMSDDILKLTRRYLRNPERVDVTRHKINAPRIEQSYFEVHERSKPEALARLLDLHNIKLALVFCNTRAQVDALVEVLKSRGYFAEGLHGDMNQKQREKVMNSFRSGTTEVLVATDVAGRGIDVNDIEAVFNYDLPRDDEDYVHRIGRTARAGKSGKAFTFVSGRELYGIKRIERTSGVKIARKRIPSLDDLDMTRVQTYAGQARAILAEGSIGRYINLAETLMGDEFTAMDIAAALLKIIIDSENKGFDKKLVFEETASSPVKKYFKPNQSQGKDRFHERKAAGKHAPSKDHKKPEKRYPGSKPYKPGNKKKRPF
jgi:ATP-dependent RNA helicase DeaD